MSEFGNREGVIATETEATAEQFAALHEAQAALGDGQDILGEIEKAFDGDGDTEAVIAANTDALEAAARKLMIAAAKLGGKENPEIEEAA